ncbi:MAG: sulfurtransferase [Spirochaetales bacterium]|nr:sulfurtransferase [Spirochaetales bacterium]
MYTLISVSDLAGRLKKEKIQIIDIREDDEYEKGHLPGAVHIKEFFYYLSESTEEGMKALVDTFTGLLQAKGIVPDFPVVIYEEEMNKKYGGSCRGAFLMTLFGHRDVHVLHGGYSGWVGKGLTVSTETPAAVMSGYTPRLDTALFLDYREMHAAVGKRDAVILDNRDRSEWLGVSSSPYGVDFSPRKGRIPGAVWLEWHMLMETIDGLPMFKTNDEIRRIVEDHGISIDSDIYIYCFKGSRASNTLLALHKAGFTKAKVYFASWYEWAKRPELPIDEAVHYD